MLSIVAWISLGAAAASCLIIAIDETRHPQKMWIMKIAMIFGFFTTYPMNRWLIQSGIKESMG